MTKRHVTTPTGDIKWLLGWATAAFFALAVMAVLRLLLELLERHWFWAAADLFVACVFGYASREAGYRERKYGRAA
jgi:hypothetical protein